MEAKLNYIIIKHISRGVYDIKIQIKNKDDFDRRYIGYTKQQAERDARRETGTTGARLIRVEY